MWTPAFRVVRVRASNGTARAGMTNDMVFVWNKCNCDWHVGDCRKNKPHSAAADHFGAGRRASSDQETTKKRRRQSKRRRRGIQMRGESWE